MNQGPLRTAYSLMVVLLSAPAEVNAQMSTQLLNRGDHVGVCRSLNYCHTPNSISQGLLPGDIDTNPTYCRRLRNSKVDGTNYHYLDQGLVAFEKPGGELHLYQGQPDGPSGGARVRITQNPAQTQSYGNRDWIRVKYTSRSQTQRIGWIALGSPNGLRSVANCLPSSS
jgi:hypothetical protein